MMEEILKIPHIRKNILTGEYVLVSPQRTQRPWQGKLEEQRIESTLEYDPACYLCPGNTRANKSTTPKYENTFVFINDFSALNIETKPLGYRKGLLDARGEQGICKVVCFSPNHSLTLSKMKLQDITKVIKTWQHEFNLLSRLPGINNVQIFENRGKIMGCSNPHPHGQIWAQRTIPNEIRKKSEQFKLYYNINGKTILEDYLEHEVGDKERMVFENEHFVVLVPFWAVWPFETMIIPKKSGKNILSIQDEAARYSFAKAIKTITLTYDKVFNVPFPYSAGIHQAPTNGMNNNGWHWHMSFFPPLLRSESIKKFMVGYEMFAMPQRDLTAESAAERLRFFL